MIMWIRFRQNTFDFRHRNHWKETDKEKEQGQEIPKVPANVKTSTQVGEYIRQAEGRKSR